MDRPARHHTGQEPPSGEYVVFHERPFPKRLDRAFRGGAIIVAVAVGAGAVWYLLSAAPRAFGDLAGGAVDGALVLLIATLAYGFTRAIGLIVVGIAGSLRRKAYVVDWEEHPHG